MVSCRDGEISFWVDGRICEKKMVGTFVSWLQNRSRNIGSASEERNSRTDGLMDSPATAQCEIVKAFVFKKQLLTFAWDPSGVVAQCLKPAEHRLDC